VLFNNLATVSTSSTVLPEDAATSATAPAIVADQSPSLGFQCPTNDEEKAQLALSLDRAMREKAPAGWKGDDTRENQVLNALFPIMSRDREATRAIFEIIKHQPGYS
jgi:type I restriction enzyme R subunit